MRLPFFVPIAALLSAPGCALDSAGTATGARDSAVDSAATDFGVVEDTTSDDSSVETAVGDSGDPGPIFDAADEALLPGCVSATRGGHEYLFCESDSNWDQARTTCQIIGYDLVVINDQAENDFVVAGIKTRTRAEWHIGLSDRATERTFVWVDGSKPGYTRWAMFQPDDFWFNEDCVVIRRDGTWNDVACVGGPHEAFVCESL